MQAKAGRRNPRMDLLRVLLALCVLLAHAPELTDGNNTRELLARITHTSFTFGELGVHGFFLLSGFLIVQSWEHHPELFNFLWKRVLRILPGYLVAALLSTLVVGLLAPGVPHFFQQIRWPALLISLLRLSVPATPLVFPGLPFGLVNGSLWTITHEFRCYLLVALLGMCGVIRRSGLWLLITVLLTVLSFTRHLKNVHPELLATFFIGACFYLFRAHIQFRHVFAVVAAIAMATMALNARTIKFGVVLFGGYLLFYFVQGRATQPTFRKAFPDVSYGIYLYGWPLESLWIWYFRGSPWVAVLVSIPACIFLGWVSWECVERPMLKLKRRSLADLPPA